MTLYSDTGVLICGVPAKTVANAIYFVNDHYRSSTNAAELDVNELKGDLRSFIDQYQKGHRETNELVSRESLKTREHMSILATATTEAVGVVHQKLDNMALNASTQASQEQRERLLRSLKFPGFNERRNQVDNAYEKTFRWVFAGDGDDVDQLENEAPSHPVGHDTDSAESGESEDSDASGSEDANSEYGLYKIRWDSFSNWLSSTDQVYWISGKPGSGKTTLVKHIVAHSQTQKSLDIWNSGSLILSHFFWRPGTAMQQNIKGLLCSLLYQLLQCSVTALNHVLSSIATANMKDADTDWSTAELQSICLQTLASYERPVCMFLDGLDEVDPKDGVTRLLNLVQQLLQSRPGHTKICLASRPEPLLQTRLSLYPRLRLQDLTKGDLTHYAESHVKLPEGYHAEEHRGGDGLIRSLVSRAEGVFLWLVLATKSINKGFELGDSARAIQERINHLPGDLTDLYTDMWKRACEDEPQTYRQTAALYFKILLIYQKHSSMFRFVDFRFNLLLLMFASTPIGDQVLDAVDDLLKLVSEDAMLQSCREVERKVDICCFGLVEFGPTQYPNDAISWFGHKYDKLRLLADGGRRARFIHRTAYDFLVDTAEGQAILSFDKTSDFLLQIRILQAHVASLHLFTTAGLGPSYRWLPTLVSLAKRLSERYYGTEAWDRVAWAQILVHCERLSNCGKVLAGHSDCVRPCIGVDFLKVAATSCGDEFTLSRIKDGKLSKNAVSEILLNACNFDVSLTQGDLMAEQTIRMLLRQGADPNWQGTMLLPIRGTGHAHRQPVFARLLTPFTAYLENILISAYRGRLKVPNQVRVLETLNIFVSHGASLDAKISLWFELRTLDRTVAGDRTPSWSACDVSLNDPLVKWNFEGMGPGSLVLASVPAPTALNISLHVIRQQHSQSGNDDDFRDMLSSLDKTCTDWRSSDKVEVLGRLFVSRGISTSKEIEWYETTEEYQIQMGKGLMDVIKEHFELSSEARAQLVYQGRGSERSDTVASLCQQAPSILETKGSESILKRWRELGFLSRIDKTDEGHPVEHWVKKRHH